VSKDDLTQALDAFQLAVPVRHISTSRAEFVCVSEGMNEDGVLDRSKLHEHRFDILPICADAAQPITEYWALKRCGANEVVSVSKQRIDISDLIESQARIIDLVHVLHRDQKQWLFILEKRRHCWHRDAIRLEQACGMCGSLSPSPKSRALHAAGGRQTVARRQVDRSLSQRPTTKNQEYC